MMLFHDTLKSETKRNSFYAEKLNFCVKMISSWDQDLNHV